MRIRRTVFLLFCICLHLAHGSADVGQLRLAIRYRNPKDLLSDGKRCDIEICNRIPPPTVVPPGRTAEQMKEAMCQQVLRNIHCDVIFKICIKTDVNGDCNFFAYQSNINKNMDIVHVHKFEALNAPLRAPVPKKVYISMEVWHHNMMNELIAAVSGEMDLHSFGKQETVLHLNRTDVDHKNDITLELTGKMVCTTHRYGTACDTICIPKSTKSYCSENGEELCLPGLTGEGCSQVDYCLAKPCAERATCSNTENGFRCSCDGTEGPKCFANVNACEGSPCGSSGLCMLDSTEPGGFSCDCQEGWTGPRCETRRTACEMWALRQGGGPVCPPDQTCYSHPDGRRTTCVEGVGRDPLIDFTTTTPPAAVSTGYRTAFLVLLLLLSMVFVLVLCYWVFKHRRRANNPSRFIGATYGKDGSDFFREPGPRLSHQYEQPRLNDYSSDYAVPSSLFGPPPSGKGRQSLMAAEEENTIYEGDEEAMTTAGGGTLNPAVDLTDYEEPSAGGRHSGF